VGWVEATLGGTVVKLHRLPRWRAGWHLDVDLGHRTLELYARGERGPDFPSPFSLDHEAAVQSLLEANGVPVAHVYGLVTEGPVRTLIMERLPGQQGLALADSDADRQKLLEAAIEQMVRMHRISLSEVAGRGFIVPVTPADIARSEVFRRVEAAYVALERPDPAIEFLRGWLQRHVPAHRSTPAFVAWDSAQFLHDQGQLVALIDFELAHVGDPYMDLAALRTRDSMEPLGDLDVAFAMYARLTGSPVDFEVLRYYEISQLTVTLMLQYPVLIEPDPHSDYVTHLTWYVESARYAFDILAELLGTELEQVPVPSPRASTRAVAQRHLVRSLHGAARHEPGQDLARYGVAVDPDNHPAPPPPADSSQPFAGWRARCDYRLARHLQRSDEIGDELDGQDRDDVSRLVGRSLGSSSQAADAALVVMIGDAAADADIDLLQLFARRMQRRHMLLGPADSLIVRHPRLQPLPDRRSTSTSS
jgi:aminoglycoside phosphotransferase (APT) family kinase protein